MRIWHVGFYYDSIGLRHEFLCECEDDKHQYRYRISDAAILFKIENLEKNLKDARAALLWLWYSITGLCVLSLIGFLT